MKSFVEEADVCAVFYDIDIIKQVNNYYPFGMEYGESAEDQSKLTYQDYLYGGKEFDRKFEINLYDFGARFYDATRSQWTTPDPLAEKYYSISPYVYCRNNPLRLIDPTGMSDLDPNNEKLQKIANAARNANEAGARVFQGSNVNVTASAYSVGGKVGVGGAKIEGQVQAGNVKGQVSTNKVTAEVSGLKLKGEITIDKALSAKGSVDITVGKVSVNNDMSVNTELKSVTAIGRAQIGEKSYVNANEKGEISVGVKMGPITAEIVTNVKAAGEWAVGVINMVGVALMPVIPTFP